MTDDEKRGFTRVSFRTEVKITSGGRVVMSRLLRNISLGGLFVSAEEAVDLGSLCDLEISLFGRASLLKLQAKGRVVRVDDSGIAFQFTEMDLDGLMHLRQVLRVMSENPEGIDMEFDKNLLKVE